MTTVPTTRSLPKRLAPVLAVTLVVSACGAISPRRASESAAPTDEAPSSMAETTEVAGIEIPAAGADTGDLRQRCIDTIQILDRRIDEEGFEFPDEEVELTEEELEQSMAPEVDFVDGVAGPDERPTIVPMADFDAATMPIPQLDHFRESCFEQGLVTEEEIYPDIEEGDEGDEDWCAELAALPIEEIREFAAEDGEALVQEEFEECGLPNPLDS